MPLFILIPLIILAYLSVYAACLVVCGRKEGSLDAIMDARWRAEDDYTRRHQTKSVWMRGQPEFKPSTRWNLASAWSFAWPLAIPASAVAIPVSVIWGGGTALRNTYLSSYEKGKEIQARKTEIESTTTKELV